MLSGVNTQRKVGIALCVAVLSASAVLALFRLGATPFIDYDEAIYAGVIDDNSKVRADDDDASGREHLVR
jgi:hypothetical protein